MFITVRFSSTESDFDKVIIIADDLYEVFNPDCYLSHLLYSIRKRCQCEHYGELVLADESCDLVPISKLASKDGTQNGCSLFKERGTYILLTVEKVDRGRPIYKSLLGGEYIDEEMEEKLKVLSNPDMLDSKKGRHSSLQNRKAKTKSVAKTKK